MRELELNKRTNETEEEYIYRICKAKDSGALNANWEQVADLLNSELRTEDTYYTSSAYRKQYQYAKKYFDNCFSKMISNSRHEDDGYLKKLEKLHSDIKKEKIKLQTLNIERNRIDRSTARQELFYEQVGSICNKLKAPVFSRAYYHDKNNTEYCLVISDIHYGAKFKSENNEYSPEIAKQYFEDLVFHLKDFVNIHKLHKLHIISCGDDIQGILRMSDLKANDTDVVVSIVEVSKLIASFLNEVSAFVDIDYYHVSTSNHTQNRVLGAKASELATEDFEYVIGNYIKDLLSNNKHVSVHLSDQGKEYTQLQINGYSIVAMHGHQVKNIENVVKDLSALKDELIDYVIMGHFHSGKEITSSEGCCHDVEVLVSPSFVGSDPYADRIMKSGKAAVKIYGFHDIYGHTESYKIILN